jgi:hypothetical protein
MHKVPTWRATKNTQFAMESSLPSLARRFFTARLSFLALPAVSPTSPSGLGGFSRIPSPCHDGYSSSSAFLHSLLSIVWFDRCSGVHREKQASRTTGWTAFSELSGAGDTGFTAARKTSGVFVLAVTRNSSTPKIAFPIAFGSHVSIAVSGCARARVAKSMCFRRSFGRSTVKSEMESGSMLSSETSNQAMQRTAPRSDA